MKKDTSNNKQYKSNLLPYSVIEDAVNGHFDAMDIVLSHFESYITTLATRKFYDAYGNTYCGVDEEIRARLRLKLIKAVLVFKI